MTRAPSSSGFVSAISVSSAPFGRSPENPVDQRRRLGFVDIADDADEEAAAVEPRAHKGGEVIAGDRADTFSLPRSPSTLRICLSRLGRDKVDALSH